MDVEKINEIKTVAEKYIASILAECEKETGLNIAGLEPEFIIDQHQNPFVIDVKIKFAHEYPD